MANFSKKPSFGKERPKLEPKPRFYDKFVKSEESQNNSDDFGNDSPRSNQKFEKKEGKFSDKKPFIRKSENSNTDKPERTFDSSAKRPRKEGGFVEKSSFNHFGGDERPKRNFEDKKDFSERKPFNRNSEGRDSERPKRTFGDDERPRREGGFSERKPFNRSNEGRDSERPQRTFGGDERPRREGDFSEGKSFNRSSEQPKSDKPKRSFGEGFSHKDAPSEKKFVKRSNESRDSERPKRSFGGDERKPFQREGGFDRPQRNFEEKRDFSERKSYNDNQNFDKSKNDFKSGEKSFEKSFNKTSERGYERSFERNKDRKTDKTTTRPVKKVPVVPTTQKFDDGDMRLNKFVSLAGVASRRAAGELIKDGAISVNGAIVIEPGQRIEPTDIITYKGEKLSVQHKLMYVLMNKPKGVITTMADELNRKTVMDLINEDIKERIYPVGRLDRDTTGLLLLTNDGDMAKRLSHPSHKVKKIYHVTLDKPITKRDVESIEKGLQLEDGLAPVDGISVVENSNKMEVGIEIHIGRNRIVRRIFEHLGYVVEKLDRVYYGGLTKKDLPRSRYRLLTEREIIMLRHFV